MAKRRHGHGRRGGRTAKRRRRQRHLYLLMDDWESGFSIREVDLTSDSDLDSSSCSDDDERGSESDDGADEPPRPLPPAIFCLESQHLRCDYFADIGAKILATAPVEPERVAPVFDVCTRALSFGARPTAAPSCPIYVPIPGSDRLLCLDDGRAEILFLPPRRKPGNWLPSWSELDKPPFKRSRVVSHALHPNGPTVFFSVRRRHVSETFTIDAGGTACIEWKRHGEWAMPFAGRAHHDRELNAWIGLSRDPDTLGHLCSCDAPSADIAAGDDGDACAPAWKLGKEKLFGVDPAETHVGATLVYLGGRGSRFCLVQCVSVGEYGYDSSDGEEEEVEEDKVPWRHLLRLTTFSLKYDKDGQLRTAERRVRSYDFPAEKCYYSFLHDPVAFWM